MKKSPNMLALVASGIAASFLFSPTAQAKLQFDAEEIEAKCRIQLGIDDSAGSSAFVRSETGFEVREVQGVLVYRMRRCVNRYKAQLRNESLRDRTQMRLDQEFWRQYDKVQEIRQRSEDGLRSRLRKKADLRLKILGKDPESRKAAIVRSRSARREAVRRKEIEQRSTSNSRSLTIRRERSKCTSLEGREKNLCMIEALRKSRRKER